MRPVGPRQLADFEAKLARIDAHAAQAPPAGFLVVGVKTVSGRTPEWP